MFVAHPDDCVIWGWPLLMKYKKFDWRIIYMTYKEDDPRGKEIEKFWNLHGVKVEFIGVEDRFEDFQKGKIVSFDLQDVERRVVEKVKKFDLVITHGADGEYGHPHHVFLNRCISKINITKIFFSNGNKANLVIHPDDYGAVKQDLEKLPLHKKVIGDFFDRYHGYYVCDDATIEKLLLWSK